MRFKRYLVRVVAGGLCVAALAPRAWAQDPRPDTGTSTDADAQAREQCASAALPAAELAGRAFEGLGSRQPVTTRIEDARREAAFLGRELGRALAAYDVVNQCRDTRTAMASRLRQGQLWESYATMMDRLAASHRELTSQVSQARCGAIGRYLLVRRAAASGLAPLASTDPTPDMLARQRLLAYPQPEIERCAAELRRVDSTFTPLTPADLAP